MKGTILVIDKMHESLGAYFEKIGMSIDYRPEVNKEEVPVLLSSGSYVGMIVRSKIKVTEELIRHSQGLEFIARAGAGIDNVNQEALEEKGIVLLNAPEGNRDAVGEHCVGMLLNLLNRLKIADLEVRERKWNREGNRGYELKGKTVGILGYGHMGSSFAEKLRGFDCEIIAYDQQKSGFGNDYVTEVNLAEFFERTEILSIHIPLTRENDRLVDKNYLGQFKKLSIVMNSARGEVLVLKDLVDFLDRGKLIGAALDVLENEKFETYSPTQKKVFNRLVEMQNVILTPHVAGWTFESYQRINEVLAQKVSALMIPHKT